MPELNIEQFLREMAGLMPYEQRTIKGQAQRQIAAMELLATMVEPVERANLLQTVASRREK